jgi:2-polyprenyl-3-methyl-5-hydroxy-6-metoxy-1,4-benzoquinol methylase
MENTFSMKNTSMNEEKHYEFGENWEKFLGSIDDDSVEASMEALKSFFSLETFDNKTFLDIGCGSGLSSLSAIKMGAKSVTSFDYDLNSVNACKILRGNYSINNWDITIGNILDKEFVNNLSTYDIVYSWGVLHHTGSMYEAIKKSADLVKPGGLFMIGIYNKKTPFTEIMHKIKKRYCYSGYIVRGVIKYSYFCLSALYKIIKVRRQFFKDIYNYKNKRGMNYWRDLDDWIGGYPYECATPEEIHTFVQTLEFELIKNKVGTSFSTVNQYLFIKN